jgi:hypothetical protein
LVCLETGMYCGSYPYQYPLFLTDPLRWCWPDYSLELFRSQYGACTINQRETLSDRMNEAIDQSQRVKKEVDEPLQILMHGLVARILSRLISVVACFVENALDAAQVQR